MQLRPENVGVGKNQLWKLVCVLLLFSFYNVELAQSCFLMFWKAFSIASAPEHGAILPWASDLWANNQCSKFLYNILVPRDMERFPEKAVKFENRQFEICKETQA